MTFGSRLVNGMLLASTRLGIGAPNRYILTVRPDDGSALFTLLEVMELAWTSLAGCRVRPTSEPAHRAKRGCQRGVTSSRLYLLTCMLRHPQALLSRGTSGTFESKPYAPIL